MFWSSENLKLNFNKWKINDYLTSCLENDYNFVCPKNLEWQNLMFFWKDGVRSSIELIKEHKAKSF